MINNMLVLVNNLLGSIYFLVIIVGLSSAIGNLARTLARKNGSC